MNQPIELESLLAPHLAPQMQRHSRCHLLRNYLKTRDNSPVYIKREDELNANTLGTKHRKYLSLLPYLEASGQQELIFIGGAHSNNLLVACRLLREQDLGVSVVVNTPRDQCLTGNRLLLHLLLPSERIHYLPRERWDEAESVAGQLRERYQAAGRSSLVIPEGGRHPAALPGILTLVLDILRNEDQLGTKFTDIWTDSGSGTSAIGLLLGLRLLGLNDRKVHITQIAGDSSEFWQRYRQFEGWLQDLWTTPLPGGRPEVQLFPPATAAAYGSLNSRVLDQTIQIARETGILMDPVYSVKHLLTVKQHMFEITHPATHLVLYNGSSLGLSGFQSRVASQLEL